MTSAPTTIEGLYEAERAGVLGFLTRLVDTPEAAEDLCQDTFVKALLAWSQRDPAGSVHAWLYQIVRNTAYDYLRRRRARHKTPLTVPPAAATGGWEDGVAQSETIHQALALVPARSRAVLVLQACAGEPVRDIARRLGCPPTTVHVRLHRGRTRFRSAFAALS